MDNIEMVAATSEGAESKTDILAGNAAGDNTQSVPNESAPNENAPNPPNPPNPPQTEANKEAPRRRFGRASLLAIIIILAVVALGGIYLITNSGNHAQIASTTVVSTIQATTSVLTSISNSSASTSVPTTTAATTTLKYCNGKISASSGTLEFNISLGSTETLPFNLSANSTPDSFSISIQFNSSQNKDIEPPTITAVPMNGTIAANSSIASGNYTINVTVSTPRFEPTGLVWNGAITVMGCGINNAAQSATKPFVINT